MLRQPELQLQLGISRSLQRDMTCSFYTGSYPVAGQAQGVPALWREGDWNTIRLHAAGSIFTVWLNGVWVTEYTTANYGQAGRGGTTNPCRRPHARGVPQPPRGHGRGAGRGRRRTARCLGARWSC